MAIAAHNDVLLLDLEGKLPERRLSDHRSEVYGVAFAPDGSFLASVSTAQDLAVRVWDVAAGRVRDFLPGHTERIWCVSVSPDNTRLATASWDGTIKLWDLRRRTDRTVIPLPAGMEHIAFAVSPGPDSQTYSSDLSLSTITRDGRLVTLSAAGSEVIPARRVLSGPLASARIAPDGRTAAGVAPDGALTIVDFDGQRAPVTVPDLQAGPGGNDLRFDQTSRLLAVHQTTEDGVLIDTVTGCVVQRLPHRTLPFSFSNGQFAFAFFPDGRRLASCTAFGGETVVRDFTEGSVRVNPAPGANGWIFALAVSPDGEAPGEWRPG
jgi:hypothetical protein